MIKTLFNLSTVTTTIVSFLFIFSSCASDPVKPTLETPVQTSVQKPTPPTPAPIANEAETLKANLKTVDLYAHVNRLSSKNATYTEEDQLIADAIAEKHPSPQTIEETALVLSVIHESLKGQTSDPEFNESDLYQNNAKGNEKPSTYFDEKNALEKIAQTRGVNLSLALKNNTSLHTAQVAKYLLKSLMSSHNSKDFRIAIAQTLREIVKSWQEISQQIETNATTQDPNTATTPIEEAEQVDAGNRTDEQLMQDAAVAASQSNYSLAVKTLEIIKQESTLFLNAQGKTKEYSNTAVRELRQKAAQAYQNAGPIADKNAKAEYLKNAKKYLEKALDDFPQADQISTVKENLAVINRDLLQVTNK